jgi:hypothetical protein
MFIYERADSVKALLAKGHKYKMADYFRDLKDVWVRADSIAPWAKTTFTINELMMLRDRDEDLSDEEMDVLRFEILGERPTSSTPIDWRRVHKWFARQYIFGLLPALLMCLILAYQGRIRFNVRRSPISSLLYLALWPVNFILRAIGLFQDIDREARLRLEKDSLFSRLSGVEEEFLDRVRRRGDQMGVLGVSRARFAYFLAVFAAIIMRVVPVVAQVSSSKEGAPTVETSCHDPSLVAHVSDEMEDPLCIFTFDCVVIEATRRIVSWSRRTSDLLAGFCRSVEHVPLSGTA